MFNKCPDCGGELENGLILDHTYGAVFTSRYAKGEVPTNKSQNVIFIHENDYKDVRRVMTKRCTKCNRLFSYAQDFVLMSDPKKAYTKSLLVVFAIVGVIFALTFILPLLIK